MPTAVSKLNEFLESLRRFIASEAGIVITGPKQPLWVHKAVEANAENPYSVLRCYSGAPRIWEPADRRSIQISTVGMNADDVHKRAEAIYATMLDPVSLRALRAKQIPAFKVDGNVDGSDWKIIFIDVLQAPGLIGVDEKGQSTVAFNIDAKFVKLP